MEPTRPQDQALQAEHAMNKLEQRYADRLELEFQRGQIKGLDSSGTHSGWRRHAVHADFHVVTLDDVFEFHETKGFMRDDANVKLKVAAGDVPHPFKLVTLVKSGVGGQDV